MRRTYPTLYESASVLAAHMARSVVLVSCAKTLKNPPQQVSSRHRMMQKDCVISWRATVVPPRCRRVKDNPMAV